ncbi:MAG: hypothetical protein F6J90_36495 [Moorea sp. SIOASIH]|nr:hypothetical protein [Moorena sp. SIOASIH]
MGCGGLPRSSTESGISKNVFNYTELSKTTSSLSPYSYPYSLLPTPLLPEACNLNFKTQL